MNFFSLGLHKKIRWYPVPMSLANCYSIGRRLNGFFQLFHFGQDPHVRYITNGKQVWSNVKHI